MALPSPTIFLGIPLREDVERRNMAGAMLAVTGSMFSLILNIVIFQRFLIDHCGIPENAVASQRGYLTIIYNLAYLVTAPFWGRLSDRFGRRNVAAICFCMTAGGFWLLGLAGSFRSVAGVNILIGLSASGGMASCMAAAADYCVSRYRGRLMGTLGTLIGLGVTAGLFIGFFTYAVHNYLTFLLQGVGYLCCATVVLFLLKRGRPAEKEDAHGHSHDDGGHHPRVSIKKLLQPKLMLAFSSAFLLGGGMQLATTVFYPWGELDMQMSHGALSGITGTGSLVFTAVAVLTGMLALRAGRLRMILVGLFGYGACVFTAALGTSSSIVSGAYIFSWVFDACIYTISLTLAATMVAPRERGLSMGIYHGMRSAGEIAFLLACPFLYESVGGKFAGFMPPALIAFCLGIFALVLVMREGRDGIYPESPAMHPPAESGSNGKAALRA
jgi:MFS family permease